MFIFEITPDWIFHTLFFLSLTAMILGFVFGKAKLIKQYKSRGVKSSTYFK